MENVSAPVEELRLGGIFLRFLMDGPTTGAGLTMFEMTVAPGAGMPVPHHHIRFDETAYGVSGRLRFWRDGESMDAGPGDSVYIRRGQVHAFANPFEEPAKVLCVITPGAAFGVAYFREIAAVMSGGGPPDPKAIGAVMLKWGLVPVVG